MFKSMILDLLTSKKALVAFVALVAMVAGHWGFQVSQADLIAALSPLYTYILAQGVADHGKEAAKIAAAANDNAPAPATPKAPTPGPVLGVAAMMAIMVLAMGTSGCKGGATTAGQITVDCTTSHLAEIAKLVNDFKAELASGASWSTLESDAETAGIQIGGCALAELVQEYLGGAKATDTNMSWDAHTAMDKLRQHAGGATFHTAKGDL